MKLTENKLNITYNPKINFEPACCFVKVTFLNYEYRQAIAKLYTQVHKSITFVSQKLHSI